MLRKTVTKRKDFFYIFVIILFSSFFYTYNLSTHPVAIHGDEAETALQAIHVNSLIGVGWYDLPKLSFLPHKIAMLLFGENIFGNRMGSVIFGIATIPFLYLLTRDLFNRKVSLFTTLLFSTSHLWIAMSRLGITYVQATFLVVGAYYFFYNGLIRKNYAFAIISGLFCALCFYSYFAARMVPIPLLALVIYYLIQKKHRRFTLRYFVLFFLSSVLFFLPQALFYISHTETFTSRQNMVSIFSPVAQQWMGNHNVLEIIKIHTFQTFNIFLGDNSTQYGYKGLLIDFASLLFLLIGIIYAGKKYIHQTVFLLVWILCGILGQIATTIPSPIFLPRFVTTLPVLYIFIGVGAYSTIQFLQRYHKKYVLFSVALVMFYIVFINLQIYFTYYPIQLEKQIAGDPNAYAATKIAHTLNLLPPEKRVIFITQPSLYADFGTLRFVSPDVTSISLDKSETQSISTYLKEDNILFVIYPDYLRAFMMLSEANNIQLDIKPLQNLFHEAKSYIILPQKK